MLHRTRASVLPALLGALAVACGGVPSPEVHDGPAPDAVVTPASSPEDLAAVPRPAADGELDPSTPVGTLDGVLSVSNGGTARYTVPIVAVAGRGSMAPRLALSYDSGRAAGVAGHGWAIDGLSAIHRCSPNWAHEGNIGPVEFDERDPLCIDGTRLILASGDYGKQGARYFPEGSVSSRVRQGSSGFTVYSASGRTSYYGGSEDALVQSGEPEDSVVRAWSLREQCDEQRNCATYEYAFDDNNFTDHRISEIRYTSSPTQAAERSIEFAYAPREAKYQVDAWWYGARTRISQQLIHIDVYGPGHRLVRRYELGHSDDLIGFEDSRARLLLDELRECDGAGVCKPPTRFTYTQGQALSTHEAAWNGHPYALAASHEAHALDADGDGFTDMLVRGAEDYELFRAREAGNGASFQPVDLDLETPDGTRAVPGDYNGDGCDDFLLRTSETIHYVESNCNGDFQPPSRWIGQDFQEEHILDIATGDFNGDGAKDFLSCQFEFDPADCDYVCGEDDKENCWPVSCPTSSPTWQLHTLSVWEQHAVTDTGVECAMNCNILGDGCARNSSWVTVDATHDGATNLLQTFIPGGNGFYTAWGWDRYGDDNYALQGALPTDYFQRNNTRLAGRGADKLVDVNGDGHADIVRFMPTEGDLASATDQDHYSNACDGTSEPFTGAAARVFLNRGYGKRFEYSGTLLEYEDGWDQLCNEFVKSFAGDWDGDGRVDLLFPREDEGGGPASLWAALSRYPAANSEERWLDIPIGDPVRPIVPLDAAGSGLLGLSMVTDSAGWWIAARSGTDDLLESVTDGYGGGATIEYMPGTDPDVYTHDGCEEEQWWRVLRCRPSARPLVSRVEYESNFNTLRPASTYEYASARSHRERRAALGFASLRETQWVGTNPISTTLLEFDNTTYDPDRHLFSRAGKTVAATSHTRLSDSGRQHIVRTEISYAEIPTDEGPVVSRVVSRSQVEADADQLCNPATLTGCLDVEDAQEISSHSTSVLEFDGNGNPLIATSSHGGNVESTVTREYVFPEGDHPIALPSRVHTVSTGETGQAKTRDTTMTYYPGTYQLETVTLEPEHPSRELRTTYKYHSDGNVDSVTSLGRDGTGGWADPRVNTFEFDSEGAFAILETNAEGHETQLKYDTGLGVVTRVVDPNAVVVHSRYDGFGRPTAQWTTSGIDGPAEDSQTTFSYARMEAVEVIDQPSPIAITQETIGGANVLVEQDRFGREVRRQWKGAFGKDVYATTAYDPAGRIAAQSLPTDLGETPSGAYGYTYDHLGRPLEVDPPGLGPTSFSYSGRTTIITDPRGWQSTRVSDPQGRTQRSTDPYGTSVCFYYGAFGLVEETHVNTTPDCGVVPPQDVPSSSVDGYVIRFFTDAYGVRSELQDPNVGYRTFSHNAFGELVGASTDADELSIVRDRLGRPVERIDFDGTTRWSWDSDANGGRYGMLRWSQSPDGVETLLDYDAFSRLASEEINIEGEVFATGYAYDQSGRLERIDYPGQRDVSVFYANDDHGNVFFVGLEPFEWPPESALWMLQETDAAGHATETLLGNGLATSKAYDDGRLSYVATGLLGDATPDIQNLQYDYDDAGNLAFRHDIAGSNFNFEEFEYDGVNRVVRSSRWTDPSAVEVEDIVYGPLGSIDYRTGIGNYDYDSTRTVTGVTSAGGSTFEYDDLGRQIQRDDAKITYAANRRVRSIQSETVSATYAYDANSVLTRQVVDGEETVTIGGIYRRTRSLPGGKTTEDYTVLGPEGVHARLRFKPGDRAGELLYHHADHLGSTDVLTDAEGEIVQTQSYDLFGADRNPNEWDEAGEYENSEDWESGFTGHKEERIAGLTNMGGRMYDARLGRFASADPFIGSRADSQAFDRYSYVRNRPLNFTDPTGFIEHERYGHLDFYAVVESRATAGEEPTAEETAYEFWVSQPDSVEQAAGTFWTEYEASESESRFFDDAFGDWDLPGAYVNHLDTMIFSPAGYAARGLWNNGIGLAKLVNTSINRPDLHLLNEMDNVAGLLVDLYIGVDAMVGHASNGEYGAAAGSYADAGVAAVQLFGKGMAVRAGVGAGRAAKGGGGGTAVFHRYNGPEMGPTGRHVTVEIRDASGKSLGQFHNTGIRQTRIERTEGFGKPAMSSKPQPIRDPKAAAEFGSSGFTGRYRPGSNDCVTGACAVANSGGTVGKGVSPGWVRQMLQME